MSLAEFADPDWYSNEAATFGDRVAGARETLGMSEEELARRLGIRLKTLHGWEADTSEPRANKLQMLAGILNVSLKWLLTGEGDGLDGPSRERDLPDEVSGIMREMRQLRGQIVHAADRLGVLEKQLNIALRDVAP